MEDGKKLIIYAPLIAGAVKSMGVIYHHDFLAALESVCFGVSAVYFWRYTSAG
jgi:hypothetical protein